LGRGEGVGVSKACHSLGAIHRWAVTGTPLQNSLQDLFSLFLFLQLEPWCQLRWWRRVISEPYDKGDPRAMATLQCVRAVSRPRPELLRAASVWELLLC
jgi:DNA repair protein RAD5